jgi:UDP-N-acetylglucosamine 2-epimerase (non-hydrolysing)
VLVVGDVNSTLACSLVAVKKGVPVVHVEAGLRSGDRRMPEEINRVLTDQISDRLYTTERSALDNLLREGVAAERVCFTGNVMIDSLHASRPQARSAADTLRAHGHDPALLQAGRLRRGHAAPAVQRRPCRHAAPAAGDAGQVSQRLPLVFALHPRTRANIDRFGLADLIDPARACCCCRRRATWRCWA